MVHDARLRCRPAAQFPTRTLVIRGMYFPPRPRAAAPSSAQSAEEVQQQRQLTAIALGRAAAKCKARARRLLGGFGPLAHLALDGSGLLLARFVRREDAVNALMTLHGRRLPLVGAQAAAATAARRALKGVSPAPASLVPALCVRFALLRRPDGSPLVDDEDEDELEEQPHEAEGEDDDVLFEDEDDDADYDGDDEDEDEADPMVLARRKAEQQERAVRQRIQEADSRAQACAERLNVALQQQAALQEQLAQRDELLTAVSRQLEICQAALIEQRARGDLAEQQREEAWRQLSEAQRDLRQYQQALERAERALSELQLRHGQVAQRAEQAEQRAQGMQRELDQSVRQAALAQQQLDAHLEQQQHLEHLEQQQQQQQAGVDRSVGGTPLPSAGPSRIQSRSQTPRAASRLPSSRFHSPLQGQLVAPFCESVA